MRSQLVVALVLLAPALAHADPAPTRVEASVGVLFGAAFLVEDAPAGESAGLAVGAAASLAYFPTRPLGLVVDGALLHVDLQCASDAMCDPGKVERVVVLGVGPRWRPRPAFHLQATFGASSSARQRAGDTGLSLAAAAAVGWRWPLTVGFVGFELRALALIDGSELELAGVGNLGVGHAW